MFTVFRRFCVRICLTPEETKPEEENVTPALDLNQEGPPHRPRSRFEPFYHEIDEQPKANYQNVSPSGNEEYETPVTTSQPSGYENI